MQNRTEVPQSPRNLTEFSGLRWTYSRSCQASLKRLFVCVKSPRIKGRRQGRRRLSAAEAEGRAARACLYR